MTTAAEHPAAGHPTVGAAVPRPVDEVEQAPALDVTVMRTPTGWSVIAPTGVDEVGDLVEGLTLADLVTEELGGSVDPERAARRSARGPAAAPGAVPAAVPEELQAAAARIAALERTVAQLEHALAARVSTERAIGVLVERHRICPREAFEQLRRSARSQGRPVAELAREVLGGLPADGATDAPAEGAP